MWYWHSPFCLSREDADDLRTLGVGRLFVRAGTISATGDGVKLILPQIWQTSPNAPPLDMVFSLDTGVIQHFENIPNQSIERCIVAAFLQQKRSAERAGLSVCGLQLDFDCATRLLPKYNSLLQLVRRELPARNSLSITSLPTWFTSPDLRDLVRQVDFYCPQFYETRIGHTLAGAMPVSDLRALRNGLEAARRLGTPFYAGIPAYGHAFMFDDQGQLLGMYRGMSVVEAIRHPSFRLARSWSVDASANPAPTPEQWVGEEFVDFVAISPGNEGKGLGYHLLYSLPTAKMLSLNLNIVRERRPQNCLGVCIFRSSAPGESMALPMPTLLAALQGRESQPDVHVKIKTERSPWGVIESHGRYASTALTVSLTDAGDAASFLSADAVTLILHFDATGVEAEPGEFTQIEGFSSTGLRASPDKSSMLVCTCSHLGVGETITTGPIHVSRDARSMFGEWHVRTADGFRSITGKINNIQLLHKDVTP
jgi:hypothetical protein